MTFLYGITDEKFVKFEKVSKSGKPLDLFNFRLDPELEGRPKPELYGGSIRFRTSPETLFQICSLIVDRIPLPTPYKWTVLQVVDWIREFGFPQYQRTFRKNLIHGRSLMKLDASYLVKLNIKDFDHIRTITRSIRKLYGIEKSTLFTRSITKLYPDFYTLYKLIKTKTGYKYDIIRLTQVGLRQHVLRTPVLYETHWQLLERWLKHEGSYKTELIGEVTPRENILFIPQRSRPPPVVKKWNPIDCTGMPPCTCSWKAGKELRKPWNLKFSRHDKKSVTRELTVLKKKVSTRYGTYGEMERPSMMI